MSYDPIRSRILPGIKAVLSNGGKFNVASDPDDQRGNEYIELKVTDQNTAGTAAGSHTKRVEVTCDFHSNSVEKHSDAALHLQDVLTDLLESIPFKRSAAGVGQYFDGVVDSVDTDPTDDDDWIFRIVFSASHTKVHS